jgi:hypothetical protein
MSLAWLTVLWGFWRVDSRPLLAAAVALGLAARVAWIAAPPALSEDLYRYQWDGRMLRNGLNPYSTLPADPALAAWRDGDYHRLRHGEVNTVYPPLAQSLFALTGSVSDSPAAFKAQAALFDFGCGAVIAAWLVRRKKPVGRVLAWLASPLALIEFAGHGHGDAAGVFFLLLFAYAIDAGRAGAAAMALAAGAMVKFYPLVFSPWLALRSGERRYALLPALALGLSYLPFVGAGPSLVAGLFRYADVWSFNGSVFEALRAATGDATVAKAIIGGAFAAVIAVCAWRRVDIAKAGAAIGLAWILGTPTAHPWYLAWALAFVPLVPWPGLVWLGATMPLAHLASVSFQSGGAFALPIWVRVLEYAPVALWLGWESVRAIRRQKTRTAAALQVSP